MSTIHRRLPNLSALAFFEAAGRHMSFTRAAEELNVTQGAVSRQMRLLEEALGRPLFERGHRAVTLSPDGRRYHHAVSMALGHVADATEEFRTGPATLGVTIATTSAIAEFWLMPRLAELRAQVPGVDVRVLAGDVPVAQLAGRFDISIQYGLTGHAADRAQRLGAGEVFPVCS